MNFLKEGKTNWKYISIVVILTVVVGGGILSYAKYFRREMISLSKFPEIKKPEKVGEEAKEIEETIKISEKAAARLKSLKEEEYIEIPDGGLSPNGTKLVYLTFWEFEGQTRADIVIENLETTKEIDRWYAGTGNVSGVAWSPNGTKVAIAMYHGHLFTGHFEIFSVNERVEEIFSSVTAELEHFSYYSPSFSPDGTKVLFTGQEHPEVEGGVIYVVNSDGTNLKRLTDPEKLEWLPVWSHKGTKIIYVTNPSCKKMEALGKGKSVILAAEIDLYWVCDPTHDEIWVMNPDGGDKKFLAKGNNPHPYVEE